MKTAYQKHNSCQDAIFAMQEAILKVVREGDDAFLSLFDLEKALKHAIMLDCLFDSGIKGRAWRIVSCMYNNLHAVEKPGFSISAPFSVFHCIHARLSPPFS